MPGKVDIKIGWVFPIEVNEPFKIKVEVNRVNIGDVEEVSNNTIGATASPDIEVIISAGIGNNIPVDQEVGEEPFLTYDSKLLLYAFENLGSRVFVPFVNSIVT